MKLKALHGFCIGGGVDVAPGQVFEASGDLATEWVQKDYAVEYVEPIATGTVAPDVAHPIGTTLNEDGAPRGPVETPDDGSGEVNS